MAILNRQEVETNISHLLDIVALGEEIVITKDGEIFAKIVPTQEIPQKPRPQRLFGVEQK